MNGETNETDTSGLPLAVQDALASIARTAWSLRRDAGNQGFEGLHMHADGIDDALRDIGIEVSDFDQQPYKPGMNVEILAFQTCSEIQQSTITATIRPAVLYNGQTIQRAQVIVSTPAQEG